MKKSQPNFEYKENPYLEIASALKKSGYDIASANGEKINFVPQFEIGILEPAQPKALHIGTIVLDDSYMGQDGLDSSRGALPNKKWVLDVYGRNKIGSLTKILGEIAKSCNVTLEVELQSETPNIEQVFPKHYVSSLYD